MHTYYFSSVCVCVCREGHRPRWPFADISSKLAPSGEVPELSALVEKVIRVFSHASPPDLKVVCGVALCVLHCVLYVCRRSGQGKL